MPLPPTNNSGLNNGLQNEPATPGKTPQKNNAVLTALISVVIVLLLALVGLMAYKIFADKNEPAQEPQQEQVAASQADAAPSIPATQPEPEPAEIENVYGRSSYHFTGTIAGKSVVMDLNNYDGQLSGSYYYTRYGANSILQMNGSMSPSGHISLSEYNTSNDIVSGYMEGQLTRQGNFSGSFSNSKGNSYRFNLKMN